MDKLVTQETMMKLLGVSKPTFIKMKRQGLPEIKLTEKLVRYDPEDVYVWLKERSYKDDDSCTG